MKKLVASLLLSAAPALASAAPANLDYNYIDAGFAIGKLSLETVNREFEYRNTAFGLEWSSALNENFFSVASLAVSSTDDRDIDNGVLGIADIDTQDFVLTLGYAVPVASATDVAVQLGINSSRDDSRITLSGSQFREDESETDLYWQLGLRSLWEEYGFELSLSAAGAGDTRAYTIGGPTYLTDNLALDINYTVTRDEQRNAKTTVSSIGAGLRFYF